MTDETKSDESTPGTDTATPEEPVKASWEYKEEFGIVREMKKVVNLTKQATELELEGLRRKLERLTYGS